MKIMQRLLCVVLITVSLFVLIAAKSEFVAKSYFLIIRSATMLGKRYHAKQAVERLYHRVLCIHTWFFHYAR